MRILSLLSYSKFTTFDMILCIVYAVIYSIKYTRFCKGSCLIETLDLFYTFLYETVFTSFLQY